MFVFMKKLMFAFLILALGSCEKDTKTQKDILIIKTTPVTEITRNSAKSGGEIESDGGNAIIERGVCWATTNNPTIDDNYIANVSTGVGNYKTTITGLSKDKNYYVRAYAITARETVYGNAVSFSTTNVVPTISTATATGKTGNTGISGGYISDNGGSAILARGICWSTDPNPDLTDSFSTNGTDTGSFVSDLSGLTCLTKYYVRAYATNKVGTAYGDEVSFTTGIAIGDNYLGGVVAYFLKPKDDGYDANVPHGLVAAKTDLNTTAPWGCQGIDVLSLLDKIGSGNPNSEFITGYDANKGIAARLCRDYVSDGYSGWFLPSAEELRALFAIRGKIGGFTIGLWWSSCQLDVDYAYVINTNGAVIPAMKSDEANVRPVKGF